MHDSNTAEFYARRERQAREAAEKARQPEVRSIHLKMASEYASKVMDGSSNLRLEVVQG